MNQYDPELVMTAFSERFGSRVKMLCAAGSRVHSRARTDSDLDLLLVLDTYNNTDIASCRSTIASGFGYPVDLSLQYRDEIPDDPQYIHDGAKSCVALTYINSAHILIGHNLYDDLFRRLQRRDLQRSIIAVLEEYLHRLYASAFSCSGDGDEGYRLSSLKFYARAVLDARIYLHGGDTAEYDGLTSEQILSTYMTQEIAALTGDVNATSPPDEMVQALRAILLSLKDDFGILRLYNSEGRGAVS